MSWGLAACQGPCCLPLPTRLLAPTPQLIRLPLAAAAAEVELLGLAGAYSPDGSDAMPALRRQALQQEQLGLWAADGVAGKSLHATQHWGALFSCCCLP